MKKIITWIKEKWKIQYLIWVAIILIIIIPLFVKSSYNGVIYNIWIATFKKPIQFPWSESDMLSYFGSGLAFIGTIALGLAVYNQTQKNSQESSKMTNEINKNNLIIETHCKIELQRIIASIKSNNEIGEYLKIKFFFYSKRKYNPISMIIKELKFIDIDEKELINIDGNIYLKIKYINMSEEIQDYLPKLTSISPDYIKNRNTYLFSKLFNQSFYITIIVKNTNNFTSEHLNKIKTIEFSSSYRNSFNIETTQKNIVTVTKTSKTDKDKIFDFLVISNEIFDRGYEYNTNKIFL